MAKPSFVKKLRIQAGQRVLILNPPAGYLESLVDLPEGVEVSTSHEGEFDFVHLFVKDSTELDDLGPVAQDAVVYDGLLWISYPKRSSKVETDLSRDVLVGSDERCGSETGKPGVHRCCVVGAAVSAG